MSVTEDVAMLAAFIDRMKVTPPLTEAEAFQKKRSRSLSYFDKTPAEISKLASLSKAKAPIAPRGDSRQAAGNSDHDLGLHVRIVSAQFTDWVTWAHSPPPYSSKRILAITKRLRLLDLRSEFEQQIDRHWAHLKKPRITRAPTGDDMVDYLQNRLYRLDVAVKNIKPEGGTRYHFDFEFCCVDCGGFVIEAPDDGDPKGPVICKACSQVFGSWGDLQEFARAVGQAKLKELGLR